MLLFCLLLVQNILHFPKTSSYYHPNSTIPLANAEFYGTGYV